MAVDWAALEQRILADINAAPAVFAKVKDFITKIKGSPLEPILEKTWPGISAVEDTVLKDIDFLSSLDSEIVGWLNALFPKAA